MIGSCTSRAVRQLLTRLAVGACSLLQAANVHAAPQQAASERYVPSSRDVLSLERASSPRVSPDGRAIAYLVRTTDWENNRFDQEIWIARKGEPPFQLTRSRKGSSTGHRWSPDGRWIAFLSDRDGKRQIYLVSPDGGEARRLTDVKEGVDALEWSPDGTRIAFTASDPVSDELKAREERYGEFAVEDADFRMHHLWVIPVDGEGQRRRLSEGAFTVGGFAWSPDGRRIAFEHRPQPTPEAFAETDISLLDLESGSITPLVTQPGADYDPVWSPDGESVLFSAMLQDTAFYRNRELVRVPAAGGELELLTETFDENPFVVSWTGGGIWFVAGQGTKTRLFRLDPEDKKITAVSNEPDVITFADISADGKTIAILGYSSSTLPEVYRTSLGRFRPRRVTDMTAQVAGWALGTRGVVRWISRDGTPIEGVLFKPEGYDASRRHPLLVIIHGGPTATARSAPVVPYVYPITQWLAKGALILMPNYRGSAGYGEEFRALNVRNLGVGDAWDVLTGVEFLVNEGVADPERVGAMGWSQGGYISAFLATTSGVFKAISVGAGISDWMTYYVNTDIHRFTRTYLKATPWDDPDVYAKTSPITYIRRARTPTLIQHGEFDRRVPIPNAYELYQGLRDVGVETKLIVYKGFGHGIDKPKEMLAARWHNWQWFARYIWGEEVEIPLKPGAVATEAQSPRR